MDCIKELLCDCAQVSPEGIDIRVTATDGSPADGGSPASMITVRPSDSPEADEARRLLELRDETGAEAILAGGLLEELELPDVLADLLTRADKERTQLVLPALASEAVWSLAMEMKCKNETSAVLGPVQLMEVQVGSREATITNEQQSVPWQVRFVVDRIRNRTEFGFRLIPCRTPVKRDLESLRFVQALAEGGTLAFTNLDTGLTGLRLTIPHGFIEAPAPARLRVAEQLMFIQRKTGVLMIIPDEGIAFSQVRLIEKVASILRTGKETRRIDCVTITYESLENASDLFGVAEGGRPSPLKMHAEATEEILGQVVPLGPVLMTLDQAYITPSELEGLKNAVRGHKPGDEIVIKFRPFGESRLNAEYSRWLPDGNPQ